MGQSNMAGRGEWTKAPAVSELVALEYRAISALGRLLTLKEPFGVMENNPDGVNEPDMKTGSMVSAFVNVCYDEMQVPIVAVSCAKGGSSISQWVPGSAYFEDASARWMACHRYQTEKGYQIRSQNILWCQGCTDGDLSMPPDEYKRR